MKKRMMIQTTAVLLLAGCAVPAVTYTDEQLQGRWVEVTGSRAGGEQGMVLNGGGKAVAVGENGPHYDSWQLMENAKGSCQQLVLTGTVVRGGTQLSVADTFDVVSLHCDTLTVNKGRYRRQYVRRAAEAPGPIGGSDAAMGYTYSKVLDRKIRIFEEGIRVHSATDPEATLAGYVVFAPDSARVEVFLPEVTVVLDRRVRPDGSPVWNVEDDDTYQVERKEGHWLVTRRGRLLFTSDASVAARP